MVRLEKIEGHTLFITNVDVVDGTPLLDIKPYIPYLDKDKTEKVSMGWFEDKHQEVKGKKSDKRFVN